MTLRLLKIEAEDTWPPGDPAAASQTTHPAPLPQAPEPASSGVSGRTLDALTRHGLLSAEEGRETAAAPAPDRIRALAKAREFVDQAYAVPDGGWVEGGGLWTVDRLGRRGGD